jgi:hypothetical protein
MIEHVIRSKDGTKKVLLTPLKAIRCQCLECMSWSASEVKKCTNELCSLYPYRFSRVPGHKGKGNVNSLNEK